MCVFVVDSTCAQVEKGRSNIYRFVHYTYIYIYILCIHRYITLFFEVFKKLISLHSIKKYLTLQDRKRKTKSFPLQVYTDLHPNGPPELSGARALPAGSKRKRGESSWIDPGLENCLVGGWGAAKQFFTSVPLGSLSPPHVPTHI